MIYQLELLQKFGHLGAKMLLQGFLRLALGSHLGCKLIDVLCQLPNVMLFLSEIRLILANDLIDEIPILLTKAGLDRLHLIGGNILNIICSSMRVFQLYQQSLYLNPLLVVSGVKLSQKLVLLSFYLL